MTLLSTIIGSKMLPFAKRGVVLLFAIVAMIGVFPEKAQAGGAVFCANCSNLVTQLIERALAQADAAIQAIISSNTTGLFVKEYVLDPAAFAAADVLLNNTINDVIGRARSGISGSPVYVRKLGDHYLNEAKKEALSYGQEILGMDICNYYAGNPNAPLGDFKASLKLGIENSSKGDKQAAAKTPTCVLDAATGGAPGAFLAGQFEVGGWDAWNVAMIQGDNPLSTISAQQEQNQQAQAAAVSNAGQELDQSGGAQSIKDADGNVTVPGSVISYQLNASIGSQNLRLSSIDELGELIAGFISSAVQDALSDNSLF